jgi:hypothetical protein
VNFLKASPKGHTSPYALFCGNRDITDVFRSGDYHQSTYVQPLLRIPEKPSGQSKTGEYTPVSRLMGNEIARERYYSDGTRETYASGHQSFPVDIFRKNG